MGKGDQMNGDRCKLNFLVGEHIVVGFPSGSDGKESACNTGYWSSIPGLGRSPGEGNGYPLQYSSLKNSMDRGAWHVHGAPKSQTARLTLPFTFHIVVYTEVEIEGSTHERYNVINQSYFNIK